MSSEFNPRLLHDTLCQLVDKLSSASFCVAYSGGADSTALLHAMSTLAGKTGGLRAIHIDHGLSPRSSEWADHCERAAESLGVSLIAVCVNVSQDNSSGLEAEARHARYAAFERLLQPGEFLLSAHHADDQMETMLLHLIRGSGVAGLSGMPVSRNLGDGVLLRPLLGFTRQALIEYLRQNSIEWIEDESNQQLSHDRNYLRHELVPLIRERWPAARASIVRASAHCREADDLLTELALGDYGGEKDEPARFESCLSIDLLLELAAGRQKNLLRAWIRARGFSLPSTRKLDTILNDAVSASPDRMPIVAWHGAELRRYRNMLYLSPPLDDVDGQVQIDWDTRNSLELPTGLGRLEMKHTTGAGLAKLRVPYRYRVVFRHGGESMTPVPGGHRRPLRKLFQEHGVLPWMRDRIPLVYENDALVAVANLWIDQSYAAGEDEEGLQIIWQDGPAVLQKQAVSRSDDGQP